MKSATFTEAVRALCEYYERKEPTVKTLDLWHGDVADIPDETVDKIMSWMRREYETFPRNVPLAMRRGYEAAGPQERRQGDDEVPECPQCNSTGYIFTRHKGYRYVSRCSFCRQSADHGIPFYQPGAMKVKEVALAE